VFNRNNVIILLIVVLLVYSGVVPIPGVTSGNVDRVTYVYEKDDTAVPRPVSFALTQLNEQGIVATELEHETVDGTGEVPEQDKIALAAAKEAGLPALVVQAGEVVVRVVKNPKTEADVMEAVK